MKIFLLSPTLTFLFFVSVNGLSSDYKLNSNCSKGISYWCNNLINAKQCRAVDFCITTVWETHRVQNDSNLICDDCKEWVDKARSFIKKQENSGEIISSLKWTCDLIPVASIASSCGNVVDENFPEIFKMLESAMDPDAICSKLFFCNNAEYSEALIEPKTISKETKKLLPLTCGQCNHVGSLMEKKFNEATRDEIVEGILKICGQFSSYSDACSSIVLKNFNEIYSVMRDNIKSKNLCDFADACNRQQNEGIVDIIPSNLESNPTIPCQLCEQMVLHLREVFITNTTEIEFKNILEGFCSQMGKFTDECISIVNQNYHLIYTFVVEKLDANKTCSLAGICKSTDIVWHAPSKPLVPIDIYSSVPNNFKDSSLNLNENGALCSTCNILINYLKQILDNKTTEDNIVHIMENACKELPHKTQKECSNLINLYGDAIVSFLDQNLDAEYICHEIKVCSKANDLRFEYETSLEEKPTCPFCLLALQEVRDVIASNKTKENIESVVEKLCAHLSDKLVNECTEFVKKYSAEVVEMLLADFTPQEACTFIKLCNDTKVEYKKAVIGSEIDVIDEDFVAIPAVETKTLSNPQCELCKEIVKIVEERVMNKKSKDEIRRELEQSCSRLKKFADKCKQFVDQYSDRIVDLIEKELEPEEVCRDLIFCVDVDNEEFQDYDSGLDILMLAERQVDEAIKDQPQCVMCEFIMSKIDDELNDKTVDKKLEDIVRNICNDMPKTVSKSCNKFVDYYFNFIIAFIETMKPSEACKGMKLCPSVNYHEVMMDEVKKDVYTCAICKGLVEGINTLIEDPETDVNLENFEEKLCEKFAMKYKSKCHNLANTYGLAIINLLKSITDPEQICYKLDMCAFSGPDRVTGMIKLY
ncbi:CLUMA_CG020609, isoform A [Clunio marinus]|uniref:CLUMA_CG020609, isoform A n=1 Tax=Clunio marinus TaxID=568069 RepID=A0A1J1J5F5_9DIPT|nr:CLUMA_CG020609, isoform A [Clunio marinus]